MASGVSAGSGFRRERHVVKARECPTKMRCATQLLRLLRLLFILLSRYAIHGVVIRATNREFSHDSLRYKSADKNNRRRTLLLCLLRRTKDPAEESVSANVAGERGRREVNASASVTGGVFACSFCTLRERYDYKGARPPFAQQLVYSEECYVMKDPFGPPNRGEVLVLGGDCDVCKRAVCLGCSVFYARRFCSSCATANLPDLPAQLHGKIGNLTKHADTGE